MAEQKLEVVLEQFNFLDTLDPDGTVKMSRSWAAEASWPDCETP